MLFKRHVLEGIARGEVTLAFRRWKRPQVHPGTRMHTALGEVRIGEVRQIDETALSEDDARWAGFESLTDLWHDLREGEDRKLFLVEIVGMTEDARAILRDDDKLDEQEARALAEKLERWDRANGMASYHRRILEEIADKPGTPAARLAESFDLEKVKFKRDVRKLKGLGLTESLPVGYRLSQRGRTFLAVTFQGGEEPRTEAP